MCVLDNAFKIQNGMWLRKGKHRWGVVKAHRRESRKEKNSTVFLKILTVFKKNSMYKKKCYVWKSIILFKFQDTHTYKKIYTVMSCETCELKVCPCLWNYTAYINGPLVNMIKKFKINFFLSVK